MNMLKKTLLLVITVFTFQIAKAQEFGDNACENYAIILKSAADNFKPLTEITDGHWASNQKDRYLSEKDFKITGIEGYLVIEPLTKNIYIINKKEANRENKQEKMKAYISMLEKCLNAKPAIVTENGMKKTQFSIIDQEKKYKVVISVMGQDDDDVIVTTWVKTGL
jgi:hypothetical protein